MEYTLPNGTRVKATVLNTNDLIKDKLTNNPMIMESKAMVEIYKLSDPDKKAVDYHRDFFDAALKWAKKYKRKHPDTGYRVIQILD